MSAPPELRALASRALGDRDVFSWTCLKDHENAQVWLAATAEASLVIKQHRHARAFAQELHAYRAWLPRLAVAAAATSPPDTPLPRTPALLAFDAAARALALTRAPGEHISLGTLSTPGALIDMSHETDHAPDPVGALACLSPRTSDVPPPGSQAAHAAAGRFARALHALPVADDDPVSLADAVSARLDAAHARARDLLTPPERAALARLADGRDAFAGVVRVPCHRDYTPDNWLLDGATLHVLDFEHARLDAPEVDLVKLRAEVWPAAPDLEAAFLAGYGPLDADARARLDVLLALHAVATLAWAHRHADATFAARGRQALAAALASA